MKKAPLQIYLDERDRKLLERLAGTHGLSMAETVREAIRRWAIEEAQGADGILALIGTMDDADLPADLSTQHDAYAVYGAKRGGRRIAEKRRGPT